MYIVNLFYFQINKNNNNLLLHRINEYIKHMIFNTLHVFYKNNVHPLACLVYFTIYPFLVFYIEALYIKFVCKQMRCLKHIPYLFPSL